ncbi:undecaprenyl-diphosphatase [Paenibacillus anaericanus]|uniref:Phosphatase PAP2 family protein n=1 Tax=Paenibacillus anaericanus TaxID=170367 RepID=A0A433Y931_9BACL|nr:phosphatase PAP2 family protein [Paenibacillus anaericanus]MDQ0087209.1 undecaprenyl-diphosphatase [Paenibacillus anaericanus]RUT46356.1 phosphatase PAP2 family protein [Paenibacillus anaericanus]
MNHLIEKLKQLDQQLFMRINGRFHRSFLNFWFYHLTHLGGARFTILSILFIWWLCPEPWSTIGLQAGVALAVSHIPVALSKKIYPRIRPYLILPGTNTFRNPLTDHSFPSGHTTAIFSATVPFMVAQPGLVLILGPIALLVAISRIYLGLHYPSDVLAGVVIGTSVALGTVALWT